MAKLTEHKSTQIAKLVLLQVTGGDPWTGSPKADFHHRFVRRFSDIIEPSRGMFGCSRGEGQ